MDKVDFVFPSQSHHHSKFTVGIHSGKRLCKEK